MNDQEKFWAGEFGSEYIKRNMSDDLFSANVDFFSKIYSYFSFLPQSVLEIGANVGMNIKAQQILNSKASFAAVEINSDAVAILEKTGTKIFEGSFPEVEIQEKFDLVFTKGVLIHINPEKLKSSYQRLYESSKKWILIAEYFNPTPITVTYRGFENKLFKRDFAGEFLDLYPDVELINYGFAYNRGIFPQDNITWFLMEKK